MSYSARFQELSSQFKIGKNTEIENAGISVVFFPFKSHRSFTGVSGEINSFIISDSVEENEVFEYPVFVPSDVRRHNEVILLLHGLNERNWSKYLPWAEYLCKHTGKAVLLFPIAYHVNRSPHSWSNPRFLQKILDLRRTLHGNDRSLSFANVALSERLSHNPQRFYSSGRQSFDDIVKLIGDIKAGKHPLLDRKTKFDVFAYSIGAFLSQVLFLNNPNDYFSESKLFMFCGGSIFNSMCGESRSIMDKKSYEQLFEYYQTGFWAEKIAVNTGDEVMASFYSMLTPDNEKVKRTSTFRQMRERISGVSLALDKVIPYHGVVQALGHDCASKTITLLDLPYEYTHEVPFPVVKQADSQDVDEAFLQVFRRAAGFLAN
jgi:pimeloyl-ACP methyl ester carboxylesterase